MSNQFIPALHLDSSSFTLVCRPVSILAARFLVKRCPSTPYLSHFKGGERRLSKHASGGTRERALCCQAWCALSRILRRAADQVPARRSVVTLCLCDRNTFESRVDYFGKRKMCKHKYSQNYGNQSKTTIWNFKITIPCNVVPPSDCS